MKFCKLLCLIVTVVAGQFQGQAQTVAAGTEINEIIQLAEIYRYTTGLYCNVTVQYADEAAPSTVLETGSGFYRFSYGKVYSIVDSVETLSGLKYNIRVNHRDSLIEIEEANLYLSLLQAPLMDSVFRAEYVDSLKVTSLNDSTTIFNATFKAGGAHKKYEYRYDPRSSYIKQIKLTTMWLYTRKRSNPPQTTPFAVVTWNFSGFAPGPMSYLLFNEGNYVRLQNGALALSSIYSLYTLLTKTSN